MNLIDLYTDIENLKNLKGVEFLQIGESELGHPIYAIHLGPKDGPQVIVEGAIHAREYITAPLIVEMVKYMHNKGVNFGIYFVPLVNPDGVGLVLDGIKGLPQDVADFVTEVNGGSTNFSQWKANIRAVDLNVNFDALWGEGAQNLTYPAPGNFIGYKPNSEKEVQALINLTHKVNPVLTLSFHTRGEITFYGFEVLTPEEIERDKIIAQAIEKVSGYVPVLTQNSTGAYPDWISTNYRVPAFTVEVGSDIWQHPIGLEHLPVIFERSKDIVYAAFDKTMELQKVADDGNL